MITTRMKRCDLKSHLLHDISSSAILPLFTSEEGFRSEFHAVHIESGCFVDIIK